jgi:FkbM family methyltransferase
MRAFDLAYREFRGWYWDVNARFRRSITFSTRQGVFTVSLADQLLSKMLYRDREFELDLMREAMAFLRSIDKCSPMRQGTIIDIGANNGVIAVGALHTGECERAVAIEPAPENFRLLQHNVVQNGLKDRVICVPCAASDRRGEVPFELSATSFGNHRVQVKTGAAGWSPRSRHESQGRVITVPSDEVDNILSPLPEEFTRNTAIVWVDVEGYEGYVFRGARRLLSRDIPVVCEIWPYAIARAGMTARAFCEVAESIWSRYWVKRRRGFVGYPIATLNMFLDEVGPDGDYENVIFTH